MSERSAMFLVFTGLLLTFGAVGGMDDPAKAEFFVEQCLLAVVGLAIMACGVLAIQVQQNG